MPGQAIPPHHPLQPQPVRESQGFVSAQIISTPTIKLPILRSGRSNSPRIDYKTGKPVAATTQVSLKNLKNFSDASSKCCRSNLGQAASAAAPRILAALRLQTTRQHQRSLLAPDRPRNSLFCISVSDLFHVYFH